MFINGHCLPAHTYHCGECLLCLLLSTQIPLNSNSYSIWTISGRSLRNVSQNCFRWKNITKSWERLWRGASSMKLKFVEKCFRTNVELSALLWSSFRDSCHRKFFMETHLQYLKWSATLWFSYRTLSSLSAINYRESSKPTVGSYGALEHISSPFPCFI